MKVIATLQEDKTFLVEMTKDEIAIILGYSSIYRMPDRNIVKVGFECNPNEGFEKAREMISASTDLDTAIKQVQRLIGACSRLRTATKQASDVAKSTLKD